MATHPLETEIEACLDEIARALGLNPKGKGRYFPLRSFGYGQRRRFYFSGPARARTPIRQDEFASIRTALVDVRGPNGLPCISVERLVRLDRAWLRYRVEVLATPAQTSKHWEWLKARHDITRDRTESPTPFYWLLYELLYVPMLRDDRETFEKNNHALLSAISNRDSTFDLNEAAYWKAWTAYASIVGFCYYRLEDEERRAKWLVQLKRLFKQQKSSKLLMEVLAHGYWDDDTSRAAGRALAVSDHTPPSFEWHPWQNLELARAAASAFMRGWEPHQRPPELLGLTCQYALEVTIAKLIDDGHKPQSLIFRAVALTPAARAGDFDKVWAVSEGLLAEGRALLGRFPHLERMTTLAKAQAHFVASRGQPGFHLGHAHDLVCSLDSLFLKKRRGSQALTIGAIKQAYLAASNTEQVRLGR